MKFWALTASLIPMDYDLFYEQGQERDPLILKAAFLDASKNIDQTSTNQIIIGRIEQSGDDFIGLYTKPETAHLFDANFEHYEQKTFPPKIWIWNQSEQLILVQIEKSIFKDAEVAGRAFKKIIAPFLAQSQLEIQIYPKISEDTFWKSTERLEKIFEIRFEHATPNLFGKSKEEMTELLKAARDDTNATSVITIVKNPQGNIKPKRQGSISRALDWIKDGGGRWWLKGRSPHSGQRISIQSGEHATVYETPKEIIGNGSSAPTAIELHATIAYLKKTQSLSFK